MSQLKELRDPETGEEVVESIYRREEVYQGDEADHAPDIVFIPKRLEYFGFGEYEFGSHKIVDPMKRGISGTHRMNGIFLAYGAAVRPGIEIEGASLVDLAPSILHLMSVPVPEHIDGRVLDELFVPGFEPAPVNGQYRSQDEAFSLGEGLSEEEKQIVSERLRNLGYIG
jgi:predicted AlkP superfamily phosphohydrolase/phosphomutase